MKFARKVRAHDFMPRIFYLICLCYKCQFPDSECFAMAICVSGLEATQCLH